MRLKTTALLVAAISFGALQAAAAADLPLPMPMKAPPPVPYYNWTGCYIGGEGGGTWGDNHIFDLATGTFLTNRYGLSGGIAGGTVGCNYEFAAHVVIGIEDDMSWTNNRGSAVDLTVPTTNNTFSEQWIDTLRGRVGYAWDRVLVYGTGGAAFVGSKLNVSGLGGSFSESRDLTGWTAGGGVEWAFIGNWSAKVEYLFVGLGHQDFTSIGPPVDPRRLTLDTQMVRVGLNYKFW